MIIQKNRQELHLPHNKKTREIFELAELGKKAGVVFHDLANHITALTLSIGYLEDSFIRDRERLLEYSKRSEKTRTQMEYVASLLRSHIEQARKTTFEPTAEIRKIIEIFRDKAAGNGIGIRTDMRCNVKISGNKTAFIQIISNIISNAIESFETIPKTKKKSNGKTIWVHLEESSKNVDIAIRDTGCGIRREDLDKIFLRNYTTKPKGHGIGLAAVKEYVERVFYGSIKVRSSHAGTKFIIKIPKSSVDTANPSENPHNPYIVMNRKQNRKRIAFPVL